MIYNTKNYFPQTTYEKYRRQHFEIRIFSYKFVTNLFVGDIFRCYSDYQFNIY
jgi:hypothetical protein